MFIDLTLPKSDDDESIDNELPPTGFSVPNNACSRFGSRLAITKKKHFPFFKRMH